MELQFWAVPFIVVKKSKKEYNKLKMKEVDWMGGDYMAPTATNVNELLKTLEEDDLNAAIRYIQFLSVSRKQEKVNKSKELLNEIQSMFKDGDRGWDTEEEMIQDMAEFRRGRMKL